MSDHIVLIVDDEVSNRNVFRHALGFDFVTEEASTAEEGLARLNDPNLPAIDCVILDLHLNGNGPTMVKSFRDATPAPIILVTGGDCSMGEVASWGLQGFIRKPPTAAQVIGEVKTVIDLHERAQSVLVPFNASIHAVKEELRMPVGVVAGVMDGSKEMDDPSIVHPPEDRFP